MKFTCLSQLIFILYPMNVFYFFRVCFLSFNFSGPFCNRTLVLAISRRHPNLSAVPASDQRRNYLFYAREPDNAVKWLRCVEVIREIFSSMVFYWNRCKRPKCNQINAQCQSIMNNDVFDYCDVYLLQKHRVASHQKDVYAFLINFA